VILPILTSQIAKFACVSHQHQAAIYYSTISLNQLMLDVKSMGVHFQVKAFSSDCFLAYQLGDVGGGTTGKGT
jgi:hypothetical protein